MYCRDRDELDSSICKRFCTDLKNDSCIVGLAGCGCVELEGSLVLSEAAEVLALLLVWLMLGTNDIVVFRTAKGYADTLPDDMTVLVSVEIGVLVFEFVLLVGPVREV
jgi:hypothetical protein